MVGFETSDDACVYTLDENTAVIQTVDFFPPIVDDPNMYGQIAAANALSDVYAMGGNPAFALNILCFPDSLPLDMLAEILDGGYAKVRQAGAVIAGGHSIDDPIPKYGLCVTGFIHPDKVWTNAGGSQGDLLVLTKPLGSGITTTAAKAGLITPEQFAPSVAVMATLNKYARDAAAGFNVSACTDITGFGLLGHAGEMAMGSGKTIKLFADKIPLLPEALRLAEQGCLPGGACRNREHMKDVVSLSGDIPPALQDILYDPQTSGGLMLALPESEAAELTRRLEGTAIIGEVCVREDGVSVKVV